MGGLVGVYGVDKSDQEALDFAVKEMNALFPKVDWSQVGWAVLPVDRAEPMVDSGYLPDGPQIQKGASNMVFVWPTKMTFAPALGEDIKSWASSFSDLNRELSADPMPLKRPVLAANPWDQIEWQERGLKATAY
jgi:hypothetical protein